MPINMKPSIIAKSDQMNADDLIGGSQTIKITGVRVTSSDQPVTINFEGDGGKPYKPCKSMCRVLIMVWGDDGENYIGKSLTVYRDTSVKWGGAEVGGIRISHMEGLTEKRVVSLTVTRGSKKPFSIMPLVIEDAGFPISDGDWQGWVTKIDAAETVDSMTGIGKDIGDVIGSYNKESGKRLRGYYAQKLKSLKEIPQEDNQDEPTYDTEGE